MGEQLPPRRKPRNDLLRNYYGIGGKASGKANDTSDIDGPNFDSAKYQNKLLKESKLDSLISRDNELVTEIRELDGDMKTLVYENYSKFISATDTIRKMKSNVEDMETEMDRLRDHMSKVTAHSSTIDKELAPRRDKIRQLDGVHNLLKKLQFIFELPNRLQQCYNTGAYPQAVRYWARTTHLFDHYQQLTVFHNIENECKDIMNRVRQKLKDAMYDPNASIQIITENTSMLIQLKEGPTSLSKEYITLQSAKLEDLKGKHLVTLQTEGHNEESMRSFNEEYLADLNTVVASYQRFFMSDGQPSEISALGMSTSNISRRSLGSASQKGSISNQEAHPSAHLSESEREEAKSLLILTFLPLLDEYLEIVKYAIRIPSDPLALPRPLPQIQILNDSYSAIVHDSSALCEVLLAEQRMLDIVKDWESELLTSLMHDAAAGLEERFKVFSEKVVASQQTSANVDPGILTTFVIDTEEWLANFMGMDSLQLLAECLQSGASFVLGKPRKDMFLKQIQSGLLKHWRLVADSIKDHMTNVDSKSVVHQTVSLVASRLCLDFAEIWVIKTYAQFSKELYPVSRRSSNPYRQEDDRDIIVPLLEPDVQESTDLYREAGQLCLISYARTIGYMFTDRIEGFLRDKKWLMLKEKDWIPSSVSPVWTEIASELEIVERMVDIVYPVDSENADRSAESEYSVPRTNRLGSQSPSEIGLSPTNQRLGITSPSMTSLSSFTSAANNDSQATNSMPRTYGNDLLSNISKLFQERIEIYGHIDPSASDVCSALVKVMLKAYNEILREVTLTKYAFWQLQVDVEYLRIVLWKFARNEKLLSSMLEEICASAYRRCTQPISLDSSISDQILGAYEQ
ncbi:hypothetical protein BC943DRAFT_327099 [Umbelopsis sp. AD052]|nr:hypothetical protein BC943DRAFT_327099 [Umbelopsis sp. AD052]